ncbi:MAG: thiol:disulfide interchange protein DsbA/DsbL [Gammaproteobacteria bacterium]|jgi:thiol:disulfide interchange protein DsbA
MFKKSFISITILASLLLAFPLSSQESIEGKYTEIKPALPTQTGDKIEVIEVFWYGCPHCYSFEPFLEAWIKTLPDDVEFIRTPGVLNQAWIPHAKAYYTAEKLDIVEKIHRPFFDAIHKQKQPLNTEQQIMAFFSDHGVSADDFNRVYNSKEIDTKIRQAYFAARDYKITGVPSVIINGKYLASGTISGTFENMLNIIDQLIEKER